MFLDQRLWILYSLKLNGEAGNDKENLNKLLNQYPGYFSRMMMLENLRNKAVNDSTRRKERAYEKHLQRLRNHLLELSQK
jgi:transmembrane sensor